MSHEANEEAAPAAAPYALIIGRPAKRQLTSGLSEAAATAVAEFIYGALLASPHRVTKPLRDELDGYRSARRGDYRIVCIVDDDARTVIVYDLAHRRDAYRRR